MAREKYQGKHDVRTMEKRGERMAHGHIAHAFQKIWLYLFPRLVVAGASNRPCGFVCVLFCGMRLFIPRHTIRRRCCPCCCHRDMSCCRRRNPRFLHFPAHSTANRPPTDKYPSACRAEARA